MQAHGSDMSQLQEFKRGWTAMFAGFMGMATCAWVLLVALAVAIGAGIGRPAAQPAPQS
jgi:hypothetical protein